MFECSLNREMSSPCRRVCFHPVEDNNDEKEKEKKWEEVRGGGLVCGRVRYDDSLSDGRRRSACVCRADYPITRYGGKLRGTTECV